MENCRRDTSYAHVSPNPSPAANAAGSLVPVIAARQKIMALAALTLGSFFAPIRTLALIPHSAPLASSQSALDQSSLAAVLTLSDAAVSGMCRNDPVNNFDPLGLAPVWMHRLGIWLDKRLGYDEMAAQDEADYVAEHGPRRECYISAAPERRYLASPVLLAPDHGAKSLRQADLLAPSHFIGTPMGEQMVQLQSEMIVGAFAEPGIALGLAELGHVCRIGRLMVGTERLSLAQARQIEFLSQHLKSAPLAGLGPGVAYEGSLYRIVREGYDPLAIHPGNIAASHRYTPSGYGGIYFSSGRRIAESEILGNAGTLSGTRLYSYDKKLLNLLDLTDPKMRASLGVKLEDLTRIGGIRAWRYEVTQPLGVWAREQGYSGIIAPAAQADGGVNLIIFDTGPLP